MSEDTGHTPPSDALRVATQLRVPLPYVTADERKPMQQFADELGDFMLISAFHAGELSEERFSRLESLREAEHEWAHLAGWEMFRQGRTDSSREEAKRTMRPDLWDAIENGRWHIKRLDEEIARLNRDAEKAVSRAYTILTGV